MTFDPMIHSLKTAIIRAAMEIRRCKGMPEEPNISLLYDEGCAILGMPKIETTIDHTEALQQQAMERASADYKITPMSPEQADRVKKVLEHKQDCPKCGKKQSMEIFDVCRSCQDFKDGFRSEWRCVGIRDDKFVIVDPGCGEKIKETKFLADWFSEWGIEMSGMKKDMGIKTQTDEGIK